MKIELDHDVATRVSDISYGEVFTSTAGIVPGHAFDKLYMRVQQVNSIRARDRGYAIVVDLETGQLYRAPYNAPATLADVKIVSA